MEEPRKQQASNPNPTPKVENLPKKEPDGATVKGGALRRGGDDDLDDLEVER